MLSNLDVQVRSATFASALDVFPVTRSIRTSLFYLDGVGSYICLPLCRRSSTPTSTPPWLAPITGLLLIRLPRYLAIAQVILTTNLVEWLNEVERM